MSNEVQLIWATLTISWVMFIGNFVLGYYIGKSLGNNKSTKEKMRVKKFNSDRDIL